MLRVNSMIYGINSVIVCPFSILDMVLKVLKSCKHFLLPSRVEPLLIEMSQTLMVSMDDEFYLEKAPLIYRHQYCQILSHTP